MSFIVQLKTIPMLKQPASPHATRMVVLSTTAFDVFATQLCDYLCAQWASGQPEHNTSSHVMRIYVKAIQEEVVLLLGTNEQENDLVLNVLPHLFENEKMDRSAPLTFIVSKVDMPWRHIYDKLNKIRTQYKLTGRLHLIAGDEGSETVPRAINLATVDFLDRAEAAIDFLNKNVEEARMSLFAVEDNITPLLMKTVDRICRHFQPAHQVIELTEQLDDELVVKSIQNKTTILFVSSVVESTSHLCRQLNHLGAKKIVLIQLSQSRSAARSFHIVQTLFNSAIDLFARLTLQPVRVTYHNQHNLVLDVTAQAGEKILKGQLKRREHLTFFKKNWTRV